MAPMLAEGSALPQVWKPARHSGSGSAGILPAGSALRLRPQRAAGILAGRSNFAFKTVAPTSKVLPMF